MHLLMKQLIDLTCPLPGTEIRYTTDGSMPTKESTLYNGALDVTETTDFAFRTFRPGTVLLRMWHILSM